LEVIPAIDLRAGRCVRLYQGDYRRETVYSDDPISVALDWQEQGASRLHLVDLDGAFQGRPRNQDIIEKIIRRTSIPVQVGGGVRDIETAAALVEAGADRVIIGTAAVEDAGLVERLCQSYGSGRLVVAVDAQDGQVAIKGWTERSPVTALDLAQRMKALGVSRLLYTDISRDGTLTEPNFLATATLVQKTGLAVLASGGIATLGHIRRLAGLGVEGVILGRALYDRTINLGEALALVKSLPRP